MFAWSIQANNMFLHDTRVTVWLFSFDQQFVDNTGVDPDACSLPFFFSYFLSYMNTDSTVPWCSSTEFTCNVEENSV